MGEVECGLGRVGVGVYDGRREGETSEGSSRVSKVSASLSPFLLLLLRDKRSKTHPG